MKVDDANDSCVLFLPSRPCRVPLSLRLVLLLSISVPPSLQFSIVPPTLLSGRQEFLVITGYKTSPALAAQKIGGLISQQELERLSAIDETIFVLRRQIPYLLTVPLTEESASEIYANSTVLTIGTDDSVELASGREELISISNALVLAFSASSRAASFFTSIARTQRDDSDLFSPQIQSELALIIDPKVALSDDIPLCIQVRWEADILPAAVTSAGVVSAIKGISLLTIGPETNKITSHKLRKLYYNGAFRDPEAVGQSLAALRQTVKGFQETPFLQSLLSQRAPQSQSILSVFNQVRNEFVQQQLLLLERDKNVTTSPLYVCEVDFDNATHVMDTSEWVPIDEYNHASPFSPLPGSRKWSQYKQMHQAATYFVETVVPALASADENARVFDIESVFASNCSLTTLDGSTLFQGSDKVSNFFKAMSFLRRRTFGNWAMTSASVTGWKMEGDESLLTVLFNYTINTSIAGSATTSGADFYILASRFCTGSDVASFVPNILIKEIQQIHLSIRDKSSKADGIRFMRSMAMAIESGRFRPQFTEDSSFWTDLLLRVTDGNRDTSMKPLTNRMLPLRTDSAATTVYRIMEALHLDCKSLCLPNIPEKNPPRPPAGIPAIDYMTQKVQLCGYLSEPLLSGKNNYKRYLGLFVASFRAALRSGRVVSERDPQVRVELTSTGSIRCSLTLSLKILPGIPGLSEIIVSGNSAFPLKIELKSEYVLCDDTGLILQHRLLESKVNGQLTPGDVISRWVRQLSGTIDEDEANAMSLKWAQSLQETLKWLQSVRSLTE